MSENSTNTSSTTNNTANQVPEVEGFIHPLFRPQDNAGWIRKGTGSDNSTSYDTMQANSGNNHPTQAPNL